MNKERETYIIEVSKPCSLCQDEREINFVVIIDCDPGTSLGEVTEEALDKARDEARKIHFKEYHRN